MTLLQMRAREEREAKRSKMDGRHEFILSTVADNLDMTIEEVEDFMLEGTQVSYSLLRLSLLTLLNCPQLEDFSSFFAQGGRKALMFFYRDSKEGYCWRP